MILKSNILLLPSKSISVSQILKADNRTDDEIQKIILTTGICNLRYAYPKLLKDFIFDGLDKLSENNPKFFEDVDGIIVVSQSYDGRIPSVSTRIQNRFNIKKDAFCIDVMDGCSGYIKAISLAKMLEAQGFCKIMVVAGDLNSSITSDAESGTKILFGDGISVSIFEADDSETDVCLFNDGDNNGIISCQVDNNVMKMNGFEVFRFTKNMVPQLINKYLDEKNKSLDSYDLVALHQASKLVVSTIFHVLKYKNKFNDDFSCGDIGNIGAGSIGAWLTTVKELASKGRQKMLAVGFGSGLSWGLASVVVDIKLNEVIYV